MTETERSLATTMAKKFKELESTLHDRIESRNNMARSFFMPGTAVEIDTEPIAVAVKQFSEKFAEHFQNDFSGAVEKFSDGLERSFSSAINGLMERIADRLMDKMDRLIEALATRPGITFAPTIEPQVHIQAAHAPEVKVDVQPTPVNVQAPNVPSLTLPERPKRTLRITHSDGTTSIIKEE